MTIGSPLNKHVLLWPELFDSLKIPHWRPESSADRIKWRNYYDYGDPIGFDLSATRDWMGQNGWHEVFEFDGEQHDFGFTRYHFPGKAHIDYSRDPHVFGHFIQTVVEPPMLRPATAEEVDYRQPPPSLLLARLSSYVLPYLMSVALLLVGVYLLFKGTLACLQVPTPSTLIVARDVIGIATLLAGLTILGRIPRLNRELYWRLLAVGLFAASLVGYATIPTRTLRGLLGDRIAVALGISPTMFILVLAVLIGIGVAWLSRSFPDSGMLPLISLGGAAVFGIVGSRIISHDGLPESVWPVFLSGGAFLYLWWLAALNFDLAFIWHRFVRHAVVQRRMHQLACACRAEQLAKS